MVAFARAKAKSIFSKLLFKQESKTYVDTFANNEKKELFVHKEKSSNYFLEALKSGGIWLS